MIGSLLLEPPWHPIRNGCNDTRNMVHELCMHVHVCSTRMRMWPSLIGVQQVDHVSRPPARPPAQAHTEYHPLYSHAL